MSKKELRKYTQEEVDDLYREDKFYNYGDNPAYKKFMEIATANHMEGKQLEYRTQVVRRNTKLFLARNWDDFFLRDLKIVNFVRAASAQAVLTIFLVGATRQYKLFFPLGTRGITKFSQTSFYQTWGGAGVLGVHLLAANFLYMYYKLTKFTIDKFYQHVILGERNIYYERLRWQPGYGNYYFNDDPLSSEENFPDLARLEAAKGTWPKPEIDWAGRTKS